MVPVLPGTRAPFLQLGFTFRTQGRIDPMIVAPSRTLALVMTRLWLLPAPPPAWL